MIAPEEYWIGRGEDVIGIDALGPDARQAPTYEAIASVICREGFRNVLDVGCNVTALASFLEKIGFKGYYCGMDSNIHAVNYGRSIGREVVNENISSLPWPTILFDCVVVKDVIEHLESLYLLRHAFQASKRCAIISFFIVPTSGPQVIEQTEQGYYHNRYNNDDLIRIAEECGFKLNTVMDTPETSGAPNRVYVFLKP